MILRDVLRAGAGEMRAAGIEDAMRDSRRLMAGALGVEAGRLTLMERDEVAPVAVAVFHDAVRQRCDGVPVSHILGWREFYGRRFEVTGDVLDPRPETEGLIAEALREPFGKVLDLGTGTGCILLTLLAEKPGAKGVGSDLSPGALAVAGRNARALGVGARCDLIESDWFSAVGGLFDLIVSNPPYIAAEEMAGLAPELAHEPRMALTDEADGLSAYRMIAAGAGAHLSPQGRLLVEIGWQQGAIVSQIFSDAGFAEVAVLPDLDGRDRVVSGRWNGAKKS
ncbi:peptide chain release factor N(5)-glutamine methyltransferase [Roseovarius sp. MMSF_3281]|uniref:peptide chain release factor N(5)-glutamine methyltransferase n=1 Tax=Roseovarius sp. MMSF_3281 TaxID=3046694 RepID=UPI00273FD24F|nr:peptide chain release factor N(5)-glutamine methyltransferase [Roseovarius sp. MMSF_3281]